MLSGKMLALQWPLEVSECNAHASKQVRAPTNPCSLQIFLCLQTLQILKNTPVPPQNLLHWFHYVIAPLQVQKILVLSSRTMFFQKYQGLTYSSTSSEVQALSCTSCHILAMSVPLPLSKSHCPTWFEAQTLSCAFFYLQEMTQHRWLSMIIAAQDKFACH